MRKIPHTTVVLTEKAQEVKDDLAPVFGLKNILSAGLVLFGRLTTEQQKNLIKEANGIETGQTAEFKLLSPMESAEIDKLRQALGPEQKKKKKTKRG